jgi:hypothetical protein
MSDKLHVGQRQARDRNLYGPGDEAAQTPEDGGADPGEGFLP